MKRRNVNERKHGGSAWESNPPGNAMVRPHNGFEDRAPHRRSRTPSATVSQGFRRSSKRRYWNELRESHHVPEPGCGH